MVQNEAPVVSSSARMFLGKWKDPRRGAKEHLRDHWNYFEAFCELAQQSPSCTRTLEQQATGGMDQVGQETRKKVKSCTIESPYIFRLISDAWQLTASLCCGFTSTLTLMSPTILFNPRGPSQIGIWYALLEILESQILYGQKNSVYSCNS